MRLILIIFLTIFGVLFVQVFLPASSFPVDQKFIVKKGETQQKVFENLKSKGYIRSVNFAKAVDKFLPEGSVQAGEYSWSSGASLWQILHTLRIKPKAIRITIPEGFTKYQIAERFKTFANFDETEFLLRAKEGYLFPDTYSFYSFESTNDVLEALESQWEKEMLKNFQRLPTREEVVVASMLEREARNYEDMRIVAGIINNRLEIDMPLQIDATVLYGLGTWKSKTTFDDLENNSGFNTYKNKGLPQGPISNPGIKSMKAAMNPIKTSYVYYLTSSLDGKMYYSKTFAQHTKYKAIHIR